MSVEVRPLGVKCNISCHYCYQENLRAASNPSREYDLELIKKSILKQGQEFTVFGGEPLLIPLSDLEAIFALGYGKFGRNAIQTNGTLLSDDHIRLFKKYNVTVGLSIDGPGDCNSPRWSVSAAKTRESTRKSEEAIEALLDAGIRPGIITTLHRANGGEGTLHTLLDWFHSLDIIGIRSVRIHLLEVDSERVRKSLLLSGKEYLNALIKIDALEKTQLKNLKFDLFQEIESLLTGRDKHVSCVWRSCDPYSTQAVQGIESHGQTSNCGRTNKAGVDFTKADLHGFERYIALYNTPQEYGGCKGCRFFFACKGQCPGTGIDGDWRNRSDQCDTWFALFEYIETRLKTTGTVPLSQSTLRWQIERKYLSEWKAGRNPPLESILKSLDNRDGGTDHEPISLSPS